MKKKLFTLLLCAFAVLGAKAVTVEQQGDWIVVSNLPGNENNMDTWDLTDAQKALFVDNVKLKLVGNVSNDDFLAIKGKCKPASLDLENATFTTEGQTLGDIKTNLTSLVLPSNMTSIPDGFANDCTGLTTVVIPEGVTSIGTGAFGGCTSLSEVDFSEATNLVSIGEYAFSSCPITELDIPASVKYIETMAFQSCTSLQTVTIPANSNLVYIRQKAFVNFNNLKDVYVNIPVHSNTNGDKGTLDTAPTQIPWCELNAFDFQTLVNQTDVQGTYQAELHYPDSETDFEYYCGAWKEGMVFTQSNLNTIKDGDPNHGIGPQNGWQQFSKTGSPREILVIGSLLRTFSDEDDFIAPTGIHVYRATAYEEAANGGTLTLTEITYTKAGSTTASKYGIPGNTGVILKSGTDYVLENGATESKFYLSNPNTGDTFNYYPWQKDAGQNWLWPTLLGGDEISSADWSGKTVINRNFGFRVDTQDFRRLKKGKLAANKAYLKLPAEITQSLAEVNDGPSANFSDTSAGAKIAIIFEDADLSQTTSLKNVDEIVKNAHDNSFYTLEGVKVNAPMTKGIYVHNGKKVVIK